MGVVLYFECVYLFELFNRRGSVNIYYSTRLMRRMLGVVGHVTSETTHRSFRSFDQKLPSFYALFCWALIVSILLLMVSGCGKAELESAKQQIQKLSSEVERSTEEVARLNQEKSRLSDDSKVASDKNTRMQRDLDDLNKAKGALSAENKELLKKNKVAEDQIASLNSEKARLVQEIEELKKSGAQMAPPPTSPAGVPTEVGPQSAKQPEEPSPCDAVIAFMKASEAIVRQQKGTERTKSLEQVKQQFAPKMKGAPEKAIKAAENWVKEGSRFWDQHGGEGAFSLLQLRNTVLDACGKSPDAAGFK
jgi:outer membrane murein-binding lipoprotein Lpp